MKLAYDCFEITETENDIEYKSLEDSNSIRQQYFLESIIHTAIRLERRFISQTIIKALNYHALACLHANAGEYRPCQVHVNEFNPPVHYRIPALMDDFTNTVNNNWKTVNLFLLSAYVYWRLNHIHPFIKVMVEHLVLVAILSYVLVQEVLFPVKKLCQDF